MLEGRNKYNGEKKPQRRRQGRPGGRGQGVILSSKQLSLDPSENATKKTKPMPTASLRFQLAHYYSQSVISSKKTQDVLCQTFYLSPQKEMLFFQTHFLPFPLSLASGKNEQLAAQTMQGWERGKEGKTKGQHSRRLTVLTRMWHMTQPSWVPRQPC